jgi:SpoVK/Ycf46/Vps4 family AAA+-type ATPase
MEDKGKGREFFVATANRGRIDPALLRRIGSRFLVDLPGPIARKDILRIKFAERARFDLDVMGIDLDPIVEITKGYSGGELEVVVDSAFTKAYADVRTGVCDDVQQEHLLAAARETSPVSFTMEREIQEMRSWADGRARPASDEVCDWVPGVAGKRADKQRKVRKSDSDTNDDANVPFGKFLS